MAETMISPTLCLLALLITLQIITNVDGKAISNPSRNEDDEIKKSLALPAAEEKGALNAIRSNEKEDFTPFYSRKLREGFRVLKGGKGGGKSKGSSGYLSPSYSPDGAGTKSSFSWTSLLLIVLCLFVLVIALLKVLCESVILAKMQELVTKKSSSDNKSGTK